MSGSRAKALRKQKAASAKHYRENRDSELERQRKYYQENRDSVLDRARMRRKENPEKFQKYEEKRSARPKRKLDQRASNSKRRVKKLGNKPPKSWAPRNQEKIKEIFALAAWLTKNRKQKYVVDHIKPVSRGGADHQRNMRVVTESTNGRKGNKLDSECNFGIDYWVWETA